MIVYKLTDLDGYTRRGQDGETKWEEGIKLELPPTENPQLCSSSVFHAYRTPYNAAFFDPIHGNYNSNAILWECETTNIVVDDGTKVGMFDLTPIQQIELPLFTTEERLEIAAKLQLLNCNDITINEITIKKYEGYDEETKVIKSTLAIQTTIEKVAADWTKLRCPNTN